MDIIRVQVSSMQLTRVNLHCRLNFEPGTRLVTAGTIQFAASIQAAREQLAPQFPSLAIPQSRPLSPGDPSNAVMKVAA